MNKIWKEFDKDGSGKLEKEEAVAFLKVTLRDLTGEEPNESIVEKNFANMDRDKSGDIDKLECYNFLKGFQIGI